MGMEQGATSRPFVKLSIQIHLVELSASNTVRIIKLLGIEQARSTVHNWGHKTGLQSEYRRSPKHVAIDETCFDSITSSTGCTPLPTLIRTICSIQSSNQPE
jgi:hypothetical protein